MLPKEPLREKKEKEKQGQGTPAAGDRESFLFPLLLKAKQDDPRTEAAPVGTAQTSQPTNRENQTRPKSDRSPGSLNSKREEAGRQLRAPAAPLPLAACFPSFLDTCGEPLSFLSLFAFAVADCCIVRKRAEDGGGGVGSILGERRHAASLAPGLVTALPLEGEERKEKDTCLQLQVQGHSRLIATRWC